jgi:hypothetical protein
VYNFHNASTGGLGLRTHVTLGNALSGSNTQTYSGVGQLNQVRTTDSLVGCLGTPVTQSFDATGQVTVRGGSTATDTLTWDALGRLAGVSRRNSANGGLNWRAVYDGLNRRLQTSQPGSHRRRWFFNASRERRKRGGKENPAINRHVPGPAISFFLLHPLPRLSRAVSSQGALKCDVACVLVSDDMKKIGAKRGL